MASGDEIPVNSTKFILATFQGGHLKNPRQQPNLLTIQGKNKLRRLISFLVKSVLVNLPLGNIFDY